MSNTIDLLLDYVNTHNAPGGAVFKKIKKVYPEICKMIDETQSGRCWTEKLFRYTHPDCSDRCKICSNQLLYVNWERGYQTYCCSSCKNKDPEFKQKVKDTFIANYGMDNPMQHPAIRATIKQTNLARYGCENAAQNKIIQAKMKTTCKERYGVENIFSKDSPDRTSYEDKAKETMQLRYGVESAFAIPGIMNKRKETWINKYGVEHPHQIQSIRDKYNSTVQTNWGTSHPMQNAEILDKNVKNAKKSKKYVFPSGREIMVQGHEPKALDILIAEGVCEDQILNLRVDMPSIWYHDQAGKKHRYYPDFWIPHMNLLIEVKSQYTAQIRPDIITLKTQAAIDAGYKIRMMIL